MRDYPMLKEGFRPTGVANRQRLRQVGANDYLLEVLNQKRYIVPVRRGWYRIPGADKDVVAAVASGCLLSGAHALKFYGGWIPHQGTVHYQATGNSKSAPAGTEIHRRPRLTREDSPNGVTPWRSALLHALQGVELPEQVAILDSLCNTKKQNRLSPVDLLSYAATIGNNKLVSLCDSKAESGVESLTRVRLVLRGHRVRSQVPLGNHQRLDLLVDETIALEIDGSTHGEAEQWRKDMRKNHAAINSGYLILRLSYWDVTENWESSYEKILKLLSRAH